VGAATYPGPMTGRVWRVPGASLLGLASVLGVLVLAPAAPAQPVELAAPYEYLGWGNPQPPVGVMSATGVQDLTLAFILSHGACNPEWDGSRPLLGGSDQAAIASVRAAGGDVAVSFGGWSGKKLGSACKSASALAGAYQKVIDAYSLKAIDIDIEHTEFTNRKTRARVLAALNTVQGANPGLEISVTMGTGEEGPEATGQTMIKEAAAIAFQPTVWTVMPFDFGTPRTDMGDASVRSLEGIEVDIASAYHLAAGAAYEHVGVSSMNGHTDEASEIVALSDFQTIISFAEEHHLGRVSFWSVNRDRPCEGGSPKTEECSGIAQGPLAFTGLLAAYHG
jgi:chitinase